MTLSPYPRVLAVDPGVTTGWSLWDPTMERPQTGQDQQYEFCRRVETWLEASWLAYWAKEITLEVVVERYTVGPETIKKTRQNASLEIIGVVRYLCGKFGVPFSLQTPADAKAFATNEKLKRCGWWSPGQQHANDATRHLLLGLARRGNLPEQLLASL